MTDEDGVRTMARDEIPGRERGGHPEGIDEARVARLFSAPRALQGDDFIQREVARRLMERLETMRIDATRVLDLGCGTGGAAASLRARFPGASHAGIDFALPRLRALRDRSPPKSGLARWLRRQPDATAIQADFAMLPLASRSCDVLWSNLALHWSAAPHRVLAEWGRVARVGGLVAFSTFGPDTLGEVRDAFGDAFGAASACRHVMPFVDMHDYGDMLIAAGFTTPVVDMERLTLTYATPESLWSDVRALGGNALRERPRTLRGRAFGARLRDALMRRCDANGRLELTLELIFAHAWKGEPRTTPAGETIVRLRR